METCDLDLPSFHSIWPCYHQENDYDNENLDVTIIFYIWNEYTKDHIAQNESKIGKKKMRRKKYKNFPLWHVRLTHNQHIRTILLTQLKHSHTCRPNKTLLSIVINKIPCPVVYRAVVYLCSCAIRQIDIFIFVFSNLSTYIDY